jgi:hypothetical protein
MRLSPVDDRAPALLDACASRGCLAQHSWNSQPFDVLLSLPPSECMLSLFRLHHILIFSLQHASLHRS